MQLIGSKCMFTPRMGPKKTGQRINQYPASPARHDGLVLSRSAQSVQKPKFFRKPGSRLPELDAMRFAILSKGVPVISLIPVMRTVVRLNDCFHAFNGFVVNHDEHRKTGLQDC